MLESDADRLSEIQALGSGATLRHGGRCADVIFDNEYALVGEIEDRAPVATMRSSDYDCLKLGKDAVVSVFNPFDKSTKDYRVRRAEPDGTGMTRVILGA